MHFVIIEGIGSNYWGDIYPIPPALAPMVSLTIGAEAGGMGVYIPPIIGPYPLNNYKMHTPNIFNLPNLLNGDHLFLRTLVRVRLRRNSVAELYFTTLKGQQ